MNSAAQAGPETARTFRLSLLYLAGIGVVEYFVYFRNVDYFFQADTIYWLYNRYHSFGEFLRGFISLDSSGWYRPLANRTIESLFYPFFGLQPAPYRLLLFPFLLLNTTAVYALIMTLTRRMLPACIGSAFYAVHIVSGYVTYDIAFMPELLYGFFYLAGALAYVFYGEQGRRSFLLLSVVFFAGSLCSKEAAVTLPFVLFAMSFVRSPSVQQALRSVKTLRWHFLLLLVYGVFVMAYLGVTGYAYRTLISPLPEPVHGTYYMVLGKDVLINADYALTWVFNIPRGWASPQRELPEWMLAFLKGFRILAAILCLGVLFTPRRRLVLLGLLWFFMAAGPALLLAGHFLTYYLFLPMAGFALIIGLAFEFGYLLLARVSKIAAAAALLIALGTNAAISAKGLSEERNEAPLLGGSSRLAGTSVDQLKSMFPRLAPGTRLFFFTEADGSLPWIHADGALFRMAYNEEDITTFYSSYGNLPKVDDLHDPKVIILKYEEGNFRNITDEIRASPEQLYESAQGHDLELSVFEIEKGKPYTLRIKGISNATVPVQFRFNNGPIESFPAQLDQNGEATYFTGPGTRAGSYRFIGFQFPDDSRWIKADRTLVLR